MRRILIGILTVMLFGAGSFAVEAGANLETGRADINKAAKAETPAAMGKTELKNYFDDSRCLVADPTGTPLNIRATPNGKIVGKVKNGATVYIIVDALDAQERVWAKIRLTPRGPAKGWVLQDFLECEN
jgi:hypothetical protein